MSLSSPKQKRRDHGSESTLKSPAPERVVAMTDETSPASSRLVTASAHGTVWRRRDDL